MGEVKEGGVQCGGRGRERESKKERKKGEEDGRVEVGSRSG